MRRTVVLLGLSLALPVAGCRADPCALEPAYGGDATDEVWTTLDDATNDAEQDADAAVIESPEDGAALPAAAPPTFTWSSALKLALAAPAPADPRVWRARTPSLIDALSTALVPRALAHLPPVTSDAYLVNVSVPGSECPVQAVTTALEATLDEAGWDVVTASGGEHTVHVVSAYLEDGRITEGPFISEPITFTVK